MQISAKQIDDFKTERKDITPPLPIVLRLVPILFYCLIAVTIILSTIFFVQFRMAAQRRDMLLASASALNMAANDVRTQRTALELEITRATDVEAWVSGSRPIQPLVVAITRSLNERSSILSLRLDRDPELPSQLQMGLRLGTDTTEQLDFTLEKVAEQEYRAFSPQRTLGLGEVDFRATLVRQNSRPSSLSPLQPQ